MNAQPTVFRRIDRFRPCLVAVACLTLLGTNSLAAAPATTSHPEQLIDETQQFLEQAVTDYLRRSDIEGRHEIEVNRLDPRLRLTSCDQPLSTRLESPAQPIGRVTVRVSCEGSSPWSVFVPAQVRLYRQVVTAIRPLKRESTLSAADVSLAERDVSLLPQGYLTSIEQVLGNKLTRPVQADQALTPNVLQLAEVVRKGDQVVITARSGGINVRMPGEAMSDGAPGTQIRVKNQRSGRIVKARVTGPGQVEVAM
ncbi:flagellar basal body P-ring formation chaperone FlgA [Stutzerimonas stutzeri]|uniref:flagellar basal body P-ring formation chaperone FlgA n=1 Tax=Stutzerimonas sp. S1 TaxID=3030652 RepID=UPI0022242399|nr:flagellar basal body P-ring formation chaperone FlgA [Stutzerimonas sp. S1]MCW3150172.1 flagellar basal body P-ring formation chaperone FlgA [Stutzerimonas sp. S1]